MIFDCIIMNPPYQALVKKSAGYGSRTTIWQKFIPLALKLVKDNGYVGAIHPPRWRKPLSPLYPLLASKNMLYLNMNNKRDGQKTFGADTPYDWYVLQNSEYKGTTTIEDTKGASQQISLTEMPFIPNYDFELVKSLIVGEEKCEVLFSYTEYETRKPWMNKTETQEFKYPCVHSTPKAGVRYYYSSKLGGFFGVPKLIFGDADIQNAIVDMEGKYGLTQHAIGIKIHSQEGEQIKKAIESERFNTLLKACRWSHFQIDWRLFTLFRKDFWREF